MPLESAEFWVGLSKHSSFKELSTYALTCLTTPVSNAMVERIFSLVTATKTRPRNRVETQLLGAITRIRAIFIINRKCCHDFLPLQSMTDRHAKWKETTTPTPQMATAASSAPKQSGQCEIETEKFIQASLVMLYELAD
ncbi:Zinc finger mym-type protein 1 [Plakobranchus ocellatus]|uniref:Zinc finger mym-type protein 1 n=1 Tax=Plakobranchus ocellatus TaxID=259542 RepID=A0AAV4AX88_9GAST|nr:Zinc finger mym-type protein 1 [Plakobranchus ocellatus]